jgi:hypothetical protein
LEGYFENSIFPPKPELTLITAPQAEKAADGSPGRRRERLILFICDPPL